MTHPNIQTYEAHAMSRGVYWLACAGALIAGGAALAVAIRAGIDQEGRWVIGALGVLFILAGLCLLVRPATIVDKDARIVHRHLRLFGSCLVFARQYPFSDFKAVEVRHMRRSNVGRDSDMFFVSLLRHSGGKILVRYFEADESRRSRPAEEMAQRLSADLQLPVVEKPGRPS